MNLTQTDYTQLKPVKSVSSSCCVRGLFQILPGLSKTLNFENCSRPYPSLSLVNFQSIFKDKWVSSLQDFLLRLSPKCEPRN